MEQVAASGGRRTTYDARGLAEPHAEVPHVSEIDGATAAFDAAKLTTRQINLELRYLIYEQGITDVTVQEPGRQALDRRRDPAAVPDHVRGLARLLRRRADRRPRDHASPAGSGWSVCENMMSGVVRIEKNAGSLTGAALRGGDIVVNGPVGARTGIDQKGGTIIVGGDAGSMTAFMMQRGRQIILGDVGPGLGDSMYDGEIYVAGTVKSLGIDCVPGEWTDADTELIERKFRIYGLGSPPEFQKFVCGKVLYNYDNLEPSERKLVIH